MNSILLNWQIHWINAVVMIQNHQQPLRSQQIQRNQLQIQQLQGQHQDQRHQSLLYNQRNVSLKLIALQLHQQDSVHLAIKEYHVVMQEINIVIMS